MDAMQTRRLLLRPWRMEDLADFYAYAKDPEIGPNAGWKPHASIDESREILSDFVGNEEVNAIVLKETGRAVGSLGLHRDRLSHERAGPGREVGYVLSRSCWGRGLMTEAVRRAEQYAFEEMKLAFLSVAHFPPNGRSRRVIEKCGFRYEKTLRGSYRDYRGVKQDEICYLLTGEEYLKNRIRAESLSFRPGLTEEEAEEICSWRYAGPYAVYDFPEWNKAAAGKWAITDPDRRGNEFNAVLGKDGKLCGFFCFFEENGSVMLGLGMAPEFCGSGCGERVMVLVRKAFFSRFPGKALELDVRAFNRRAAACYRRAGFREVARCCRDTPLGPDEFIRMKLAGEAEN